MTGNMHGRLKFRVSLNGGALFLTPRLEVSAGCLMFGGLNWESVGHWVLVCRLFDVWKLGMVLDTGFLVCRLFDVWRLKLGECWTLGFICRLFDVWGPGMVLDTRVLVCRCFMFGILE